jgi:hypothetical protein
MFQKTRDYVYLFLQKIGLLPIINLIRIGITLADKEGFYKSTLLGLPVDKFGLPIPWFSYPAINFLNQYNLDGKKVFEWGSGNSSLYWASRCQCVVSVENNLRWYKKIVEKTKKIKKLKVVYAKNKTEYLTSIQKGKSKFDIIVIDGYYRKEAAQLSADRVKSGGMIILDNSDWHPGASKYLRDKKFIEIDMAGFGPINPYTTTTSFYIKGDFSFTSNKVRPKTPNGGLPWFVD